MIEPISTLANRNEPGVQRPESPTGGDFAAMISARSGEGARRPHARPGADEPATVGRDVNLAALAAQELVTPGTPRAEVAAARAEARAPGETAAQPESHRARSIESGPGSQPAGRENPGSDGKASPAASSAAAPAASPTRQEPVANAGTTAPPAPAAPAGTRMIAAATPLVGVASAGSVRSPAAGSPSPVQSGTIRPPTGPAGRQSPISVFKAPTPNRPSGAAPEAFAAQLKRGLAAVLRQSGGSVTVRMAPEGLGQVRIRLDMDQGHVSARFDVGGHEARRLLETDLDVLRRTLEARGLRVDELHVSVRPELAGPKDQPADHGGRPASDSPEQQEASAGGAGHRDPSAGERTDPSDSRQDAATEPDPDLPTVDPWVNLSGGAGNTRDGSDVLRLRLDAVA